MLQQTDKDTIDYELYRNSLVKSFEMTLEQSGKLLRKKILPYMSSKKSADMLSFKDVFRQAYKCSLLSEEETVRWMKYRDNRNQTAYDYGQAFAEQTLVLMNDFILDAKKLKGILADASS